MPQTSDESTYLKQQLMDKLIEYKPCICKFGEDLPQVCNWKWDPTRWSHRLGGTPCQTELL